MPLGPPRRPPVILRQPFNLPLLRAASCLAQGIDHRPIVMQHPVKRDRERAPRHAKQPLDLDVRGSEIRCFMQDRPWRLALASLLAIFNQLDKLFDRGPDDHGQLCLLVRINVAGRLGREWRIPVCPSEITLLVPRYLVAKEGKRSRHQDNSLSQ